LVEYVTEDFGGYLGYSYTPGADHISYYDEGCCGGSSHSFDEEEVRRLYNLLGCWLDAREK
jgi:hypothetical protein